MCTVSSEEWHAHAAEWHDQVPTPDPSTVHFPDPEWIGEYFKAEAGSLHATFLECSTPPASVVVPTLACNWNVPFRFGPLSLGGSRLRCIRLLGGIPRLPDNPTIWDDLLCDQFCSIPDWDAILVEGVPVDGFFWNHVKSSEAINRRYKAYCLRGPTPRYVVRIRGSYEEYLKTLSNRHNRLREVRLLEQQGPVTLRRVELPGEVAEFVGTAATISRKGYQYLKLGLGINDVELFRRRMELAAKRGWLRSYLLSCGDTPVAFQIGYQYNGRYHDHMQAYDPEWAKHSVGSVMLLKIIEDLFRIYSPGWLDFSSGGGYKRYYANEEYPEANVVLVRPKIAARGSIAFHHLLRGASTATKAVISRLPVLDRGRSAQRKAKH